jgi:hypothetical protein
MRANITPKKKWHRHAEPTPAKNQSAKRKERVNQRRQSSPRQIQDTPIMTLAPRVITTLGSV